MSETLSRTRGPLSDEEVAAYHRDGQLTPAQRLPQPLFERMSAAIERLIVDNPEVRPEQLVGAHIKASRDSGVRGAAELLDCARDPAILDAVEQLIGPDLIFWGSQVFSKPAGDGMAIPWHQDGQYWPMRPLKNVTVWVAVDAATVDNGCMRIVPGTHTQGLLEHVSSTDETLALDQGLKPGAFDEATAYDVELEPGQFSLHDAMVVHGSNANRSGRRRCGYAMRFMPATSHFDRSLPPTRIAHNQVLDFSQRPIWLVRGEDRAGNDFSPGR
jgi:ectoine hydroxylase-related dioxygenase (phytanoyl-CoA dioxygenase family)